MTKWHLLILFRSFNTALESLFPLLSSDTGNWNHSESYTYLLLDISYCEIDKKDGHSPEYKQFVEVNREFVALKLVAGWFEYGCDGVYLDARITHGKVGLRSQELHPGMGGNIRHQDAGR